MENRTNIEQSAETKGTVSEINQKSAATMSETTSEA